MRHRVPWMCAAAVLIFTAGCKKGANENEQIRAAIVKRLTERGTLNMGAFDTDLKQVNVQGDKAQADVVFHPKNGPQEAQMQMSYSLEKRNGVWTVLESKTAGGGMNHPPMDGGQGGSPVSDALKNFHGQAEGAQGALPPGHPPIQGAAQPAPAPQKKP